MTAQTILPANSAASGGYDVDNSCRFDDGSSDHMHKTPGSAGSRIKWTFSVWLKRGVLGAMPILAVPGGDTNNYDEFYFNGSDKIQYSAMVSGTQYALRTARVFRDPAAWIHLVLIYDSNNGTAGDRMQLWVNGIRTAEADFEDTTFKNAQNYSSSINNDKIHYLGKVTTNTAAIFDGYMTEVVFQNNSADSPVDKFGEFDEDSGIWKPIKVSGLTLGTNGFYLDFEDSSNLGNDVGGGTDLTEVNIDATNQSTDTCTNNFATFNGVLKQMSTMALSEGNLQGATSSSHEAFFGSFFSSIGVTTGKWYAEFKCTGNANRVYVGISSNLEADVLGSSGSAYTFAYKGNGWAYGGQDGKIAHTNSDTFLDYGAALSNNDIVGVALDLDELEIYFSVNGSFQNSGDPTSGSSQTGGVVTAGGKVLNGSGSTGTYYFCVSDNDQGTVCTVQANFGSPIHSISSGNADGNGYGNFEYAVPSGYFALCTKNLAEYGG